MLAPRPGQTFFAKQSFATPQAAAEPPHSAAPKETQMTKWHINARGTAFILLLWVIGWGLGFGGIMELLDPHGKFLDVWPTAMAIPGLFGGVVFCALLAMAEGGRSLDEVSLARAAVYGATAGLVLAGVAVTKLAGPISRVISHIALALAAAMHADVNPMRIVAAISVLVALGAIAALGTMIFFRLLTRRRLTIKGD